MVFGRRKGDPGFKCRPSITPGIILGIPCHWAWMGKWGRFVLTLLHWHKENQAHRPPPHLLNMWKTPYVNDWLPYLDTICLNFASSYFSHSICMASKSEWLSSISLLGDRGQGTVVLELIKQKHKPNYWGDKPCCQGFCPLGPEVSGPRHFGVESVHRAHSWQQVGTLVFRLAILVHFNNQHPPRMGRHCQGASPSSLIKWAPWRGMGASEMQGAKQVESRVSVTRVSMCV